MEEDYNLEENIKAFTKYMTKKEKKSFRKCVNHELSKDTVRNRLRKKLDERKKEGW